MSTEVPNSMAVLRAVAAHEGIDVTDIQKPLHDVIDPDALDRLFPGEKGHVTFRYLDYVVSVEAGGKIELEERRCA